jgi:hypothetical protein
MKTAVALIFVTLSITALAQQKAFSIKNNKETLIDLSQPLFIVDGIPTSQFEFNLINPDNIAKMEVMKAKEAIMLFGDRARNGVILVTTKKSPKEKSGNQ